MCIIYVYFLCCGFHESNMFVDKFKVRLTINVCHNGLLFAFK